MNGVLCLEITPPRTIITADAEAAVRLHAFDHDGGAVGTLGGQWASAHSADKALDVILGLDAGNAQDGSLSQVLVTAGAKVVRTVGLDEVGRLVAIYGLSSVGCPGLGTVLLPVLHPASGETHALLDRGMMMQNPVVLAAVWRGGQPVLVLAGFGLDPQLLLALPCLLRGPPVHLLRLSSLLHLLLVSGWNRLRGPVGVVGSYPSPANAYPSSHHHRRDPKRRLAVIAGALSPAWRGSILVVLLLMVVVVVGTGERGRSLLVVVHWGWLMMLRGLGRRWLR